MPAIALLAMLAATLMPVVAATCQQPATAANQVVVTIECAAPGKAVRRVPGDHVAAELATAKRWVDRKLAWRVGDQRVVTPEALAKELERVAKDPSSLRDSPDHPGTRQLLPVRIVPGEDARWCDVIGLQDSVIKAGFQDFTIEGLGTRWCVAKSIAEPWLGGGVLIVPRCVYNEPDDRPDALRPTFDVHQDGHIAHDGTTLFTWVVGKADNLEPLRIRLRDLRAELASRGRLVPREGDRPERLDVPLLVRADQWALWHDVRRLITAATDPAIGFWKLELGVCEIDMEAKLQASAKDGGR